MGRLIHHHRTSEINLTRHKFKGNGFTFKTATLSLGANSFLLAKTPFQKEGKQESIKVVSFVREVAQNLQSVSV